MFKIDLQRFGGRGATSGGGGIAGNVKSAYTVTSANGQTMQWYFTSNEGRNYYSNSLNEIPKPTPNNMTPREMVQRVEQNGGTATKKTASQLRQEVKTNQQQKQETNNVLNAAYVRDRNFVRGSRAARVGRRAARRGI